MASLNIELPMYVIAKKRRRGTAFYFQVPARLRPQGWPGAFRIPLEYEKRTGLANAVELAAVSLDAEALYSRLVAERSGKKPALRPHTLPWLIQSFENHQRTTPREKAIAKSTLKGYAYAARQVVAWSRESGHPTVRLITRPAIIKFLGTLNDTPTKRKFIASYLRSLMFHAMDLGIRTDNPAIKLKVEVPKAIVHIWTDAELNSMVEAGDKLDLQNVATAILIAHDEGPRPIDILKFRRFEHYTPKDASFRYFQTKTRDWVVSPAGRRVRERLAKQPSEQLMLVINRRTGRQYNERVFNRDFDRLRVETGLAHLQFRHLRHSFVVKCKRAGLDDFEIAAKTGHSVKSVRDILAKHYLPHDSEVATNATAKMEAYRERKLDVLV